MNSTDLPPVSPTDAENDSDDVWPTAGAAKGLRVRLPIAIACLAVVALAGVATGAALKKPSSNTAVQAGAIGANGGAGNRAGANGAPGANGAGRFGAGGGVFGTVSKVDSNILTVTQADGSTATVVVPSGTAISKTVSGSLSDLANGTSIVVRGTTADGKTTAESITINPANGAGFPAGFGGRNRGAGTGTGAGNGTGTGTGAN